MSKMIEIEKKDYEAVLLEIVSTRDLRQLIQKSMTSRHRYRSIILDISKGSRSRNFKVIKEISRSKKVSESFIVDQAKSVVSFFSSEEHEKAEDYYGILECSQSSDEEEIRTNWIRLMKIYHPDKIGEPGLEKTKKINEAYNVLSDPEKRDGYDRSYFPNIPIKIKDINYRKFNNRNFAVVITLLFLLIPSFYIYLTVIGKSDRTSISKKRIEETKTKNSNAADVQVNHDSRKRLAKPETLVVKKNLHNSKDEAVTNQEYKNKVIEESKPKIAIVDKELDAVKAPQASDMPESRELKEDELYEQANIAVNDSDNLAISKLEKENGFKKAEQYEHQKEELVAEAAIIPDVGAVNKIKLEYPLHYTVQKGDSLWSLSDRFDVSIKDIKSINSLYKKSIQPGDVLVIDKTSGKLAVSEVKSDGHVKSNPKPSETDQKRWISKGSGESTTNPIRKKEKKKGLLKVSSLSREKGKSPDKSSVYSAISDYIFAYKNRDMKKLGTLFDTHAKENGISMDQVFKRYKKNFEVLNIIAYDIKFNKVNLKEKKASVDGNFMISFTTSEQKDIFKKSYGDINWELTWNDKNWLINEIRYNVTGTKIEDDFNR